MKTPTHVLTLPAGDAAALQQNPTALNLIAKTIAKATHTARVTNSTNSSNPPTQGEIDECIEKVCNSTQFNQAPKIRRVMMYCIKAAVQNPNHKIKEYELATMAMGKQPTFDAHKDTSVRVAMVQIRRRLKTYYANEGVKDEVRISFQPSNYTPAFLRWDSSEPTKLVLDHLVELHGNVTSISAVGA